MASTTAADPYAGVTGQPAVVELLRRSAADPLPAYLFLGPRGSGRLAAARAFAADVLAHGAADPGAAARDVRLAVAGKHPDVTVFERAGPYIDVRTAEEIIRQAGLAPVEGSRQVLVLTEFELVREVGPMLLKTIEEPPPSTHFVILASEVPVELVTIASRCVRVEFARIPDRLVAETLVGDGVDHDRAATIAEAVGGDLGRARLLADDPAFVARREAWWSAPDRLDGTGAAVATTADELLGLIDEAAAPLKSRHATELDELDRDEEMYGERRGARRALEDRQKREMRRLRTDEMRMGLATLGAAVRDGVAHRGRAPGRAARALDAITTAGEALTFNANERLLLQHVLLQASPHD